MAEQFQLAEAERDGTLIIVMRGELDIASAAALDIRLREALLQDQRIELDLSAISFVDSTGLGVLANAADAADRNGSGFTITAASNNVLRVVELTGLTERLNMAAWLESADPS